MRELGPVLTALMVGGRVGAGITAELGSMTVSEQVDALRSLGADPVRKLVVPRMWALLIGLPLLVVLADVMGILGGLIIATWELGLAPGFYTQPRAAHAGLRRRLLRPRQDRLLRLRRSPSSPATTACTRSGGADGVGRATTNTVVAIAISVLVLDFFLTKLFLSL